ncbi:hypothetical protein LTR86_010219 [Recurvomyces mirabilis]|nr:hypothetical protein LTR86_010219 [Recurvomyces mirabilis]
MPKAKVTTTDLPLRPSCARCMTLHTDCAYEAEEGESRWSALRRRNQILETERAESRELMHYLQTRPEHEAQDIFQRIRSGGYEDLSSLLRQVRQNDVQSPSEMNYETIQQQRPPFEQRISASSSGGSVGEQQRLPPIRSMFDVSDTHGHHQQQQQQQHPQQHPQHMMDMTGPMQNSYGQQQDHRQHSMSSRDRGSYSSSEHPFTSAP